MSQQYLFLLMGPKGSGKTHIGSLIDKNFPNHIKFIRVENVWLNLKPGENGWQKVEEFVDDSFKSCQKSIMIESLGIGPDFPLFFQSLNSKYCIKLIKIQCNDLDVCASRVKSRDLAVHVPVSDEKLAMYNCLASKVEMKWDLVIDNTVPLQDEAIVEKFKIIVQDLMIQN